jgi:hypothetical protein
LLLTVALVAGQGLLLVHEAEHIGHVDDGDCIVCLTGASLGAGVIPASLAPLPVVDTACTADIPIDRPLPTDAFEPYLPRAPPTTIRC